MEAPNVIYLLPQNGDRPSQIRWHDTGEEALAKYIRADQVQPSMPADIKALVICLTKSKSAKLIFKPEAMRCVRDWIESLPVEVNDEDAA